MRKSLRNGQALVELLLAIALAAIVLPALITGFVSAREGRAQQKVRLDAIALVQDAQEKARAIRERGWNYFTCLNPCYPIASGNTYSFYHDPANKPETVGIYQRKVEFFPVNRDITTDEIITPGSAGHSDPSTYYVDPATYKVIVTVTWTTPLNGSVSETTYMTRFLDNITITHTTTTDFASGNIGIAPNAVLVTKYPDPADDGHFTSSPAGHGAWCYPDPNVIAPIGLPLNGTTNIIRAYADPAGITNRAFIGTGTGSSNTVAYVDVNIANPPYPSPPIATVRGVWNQTVGGNGSIVKGIWGDDIYTYLATSNSTEQFAILNTAVLTPTPAPSGIPTFNKVAGGNLNLGGSQSGTGVFVDKTTNQAYVVQNRYLYIYNVADPLAPILMGTYTSRTSSAIFNGVYVRGQYAYLTNLPGQQEELTVLDISNPAAPKFAAWADVSSGSGGVDMWMNPEATRLYIVSSHSNDALCLPEGGSGKEGCEFMALNISDRSRWTTPVWYPNPSPTPHPTNGAPGRTETFPTIPVAVQYDLGTKFDPKGMAIVFEVDTPTPPNTPKPTTAYMLFAGYELGGASPVMNPTPTPDYEYKVMDISEDSNFYICGQAHVQAGINGIAAVREVDGDSYAYLITNDAAPTPQFKMIQGGPGVFGTLAVFTSAPMTAAQVGASDAVFNRFHADLKRLNGVTDVKIQVASAIAADCTTATYSFIGPDKTNATYYMPNTDSTVDGIIPIGSYASGAYSNPGQCFKYQVSLTTNDVNYRPDFDDFTLYLTP